MFNKILKAIWIVCIETILIGGSMLIGDQGGDAGALFVYGHVMVYGVGLMMVEWVKEMKMNRVH